MSTKCRAFQQRVTEKSWVITRVQGVYKSYALVLCMANRFEINTLYLVSTAQSLKISNSNGICLQFNLFIPPSPCCPPTCSREVQSDNKWGGQHERTKRILLAQRKTLRQPGPRDNGGGGKKSPLACAGSCMPLPPKWPPSGRAVGPQNSHLGGGADIWGSIEFWLLAPKKAATLRGVHPNLLKRKMAILGWVTL